MIKIDMLNDEYHSRPEVSKSQLDLLNKSPMHFKYFREHTRDETASMRFGSALHCALLEPDQFDQRYAVSPDIDRRTKAGKEQYAAFESAADGKVVISHEFGVTIEAMKAAASKDEKLNTLLRDGMAEVSCFWTDIETGVECRCRPDYLRKDGIILDLKTTQDASPTAFQRSIASYSYYLQAAMYQYGVACNATELGIAPGSNFDFVFIAIEKTPPHGIAIYQLDEAGLELGRAKLSRLLRLYQHCSMTSCWPGYAGIRELSVPAYMHLEEELNASH